MGADLFEARDDLLGARTDEILGFSLRSMCLDGPEEELTRTEHAQPALFALSYALWELAAGELALAPKGAAGHSLGEYTALAAAGVFDFDTGLALVAARGRAMGRAAAGTDSGMAALLGASREAAEGACRARRDMGGVLHVANVNAPGQVVVAEDARDEVRRHEPEHAEQSVHGAEHEAERPRGAQGSREAEVQRDRGRREVDDVVDRRQVEAEEMGLDEPDQARHGKDHDRDRDPQIQRVDGARRRLAETNAEIRSLHRSPRAKPDGKGINLHRAPAG